MKGTIVKLAGFVAVTVAITVWLAFTIGNIRPFRDTYDLTATFDDVTGLLRDDNVKVAGVVVGKVTDIRIEKGKAKVDFTVKKGVKVPSDSSAAVRWRNLLGQRYVYIYPGESSTVLRDDDRIAETRSVVDLGELFNRLGPIVQAIDPKQVNQFLDAVVQALDGNEAKLRQSLDDLAVLAGSLAQRDEAIGRMVENLNTVAGTVTTRDQQIRTVLDNLVQIAASFSENADVLDAAVTDMNTLQTELSRLLGNNRDELDRIVANLNTLTDVVADKLPALDRTVANLDEGASRLFATSRHGHWLNQIIPCGAVGYPYESRVDTPCTPEPGSGPRETDNVEPGGDGGAGASGSAGGARAALPPGATTGVRAILELLGTAR